LSDWRCGLVLETSEGLSDCVPGLKLAMVWERGGLAARLVDRFAVAVRRGVGACRSELILGAAPLSFGASRLVARAGCGGVAGRALGYGSNTGFHLTRLAPLGSAEKRALGVFLGRRLYLASAAQVKPRR